MAQETRINPDWVDAPYEMEADGKLVHVPKYIYVPT